VLDKYKANSDVTAYLNDVQNDILENVSQFVKGEEPQQSPFQLPWMKEAPFKKYE